MKRARSTASLLRVALFGVVGCASTMVARRTQISTREGAYPAAVVDTEEAA